MEVISRYYRDYKGVINMLEMEQLQIALEPFKAKLVEMGNSL